MDILNSFQGFTSYVKEMLKQVQHDKGKTN